MNQRLKALISGKARKIFFYFKAINMQGALPTPQLRVNPACLPVCYPTSPKRLKQARLLALINTYLHIILYHTIIYVYTLIGMLTHTQIKLRMYNAMSASHANFGVTRGN